MKCLPLFSDCCGGLKLKPDVSAGENAEVEPSCTGLLNVKPTAPNGLELSALVTVADAAALDDGAGAEPKLKVGPVPVAGGLKLKPTTENYL